MVGTGHIQGFHCPKLIYNWNSFSLAQCIPFEKPEYDGVNFSWDGQEKQLYTNGQDVWEKDQL